MPSNCDSSQTAAPADADIWRLETTFPSVSGKGSSFIEAVVAELERQNWPAGDLFAVQMALEEAITNAIEHGNARNPDKTVRVLAEVDSARLFITVGDEGPGFDKDAVRDPTEPENLDRPAGRGLFLIRNFMTKVWHNDSGNEIYMQKTPTAD